MEIGRLIVGIVCCVIAVALGIYVSFTLRQKGPIFSNTYLWLSKEEREKADKKAEYRLVSVVFGLLALAALSEGMFALTDMKLFSYIGVVFIAIDLFYAIKKSYIGIK